MFIHSFFLLFLTHITSHHSHTKDINENDNNKHPKKKTHYYDACFCDDTSKLLQIRVLLTCRATKWNINDNNLFQRQCLTFLVPFYTFILVDILSVGVSWLIFGTFLMSDSRGWDMWGDVNTVELTVLWVYCTCLNNLKRLN